MILTIKDLTKSCSHDHSNPHHKRKHNFIRIRIKSRKEKKLSTWALGGSIHDASIGSPLSPKEKKRKIMSREKHQGY